MAPVVESLHLELQKSGILIPVTNVPPEAVLATCGDGDASIPHLHRTMATLHHPGKRIRHHLATQNGGYLKSWEWVTDQILGGITIKSLTRVVICGHAPCAMAQAFGITIWEQIDEQQRLIRHLLADGRFEGIQIFSHFHLDTGEENVTGLFELRG